MPQKPYKLLVWGFKLPTNCTCMKNAARHFSESYNLFHKRKKLLWLWNHLKMIKSCYFWNNLFFKDQNHDWGHTFALTAGKRALKQVARNTPPPKQLLKATTLLYLVILSYSICIIRTGIRMPPNIRANTPSRHRILATAISIIRRWTVIPLQQSIWIFKKKDTSPGRLVRSWTASLEHVLETSVHGVS